MKLKNILMSLIVIISSLFITTVKADTAPNSFVIRASDTTLLYGSNYLGNGSTLNFTYKKTSSGKIVYCTEIHDSMTSSTETYTLSKEMDAKFAYVLANGYPDKSITGNSYKDYYITGLAIWYLISPNDSVFTHFNLSAGTYKGVSSQVVKEVAKLVNGAKNYSYATPTIKINNVTNSFTLSSDKKYYVSNAMSVTTTGNISTYNVSLTNALTGTIITDTNGTQKTSFKTNESFIIKVPVANIKNLTTSFSIKASGTGSVFTAYLYKPSVNAHQALTTGYQKNIPVSTQANLKLAINTKAEIIKIDASTNKALAGATLELTGPNNFKQTWKTETTAKIFSNLAFGKYTLKETKAPTGYKTSKETITFEIKADNTSVKATFKNVKEGKVVISKQDATNEKEVPGATLVLTGPNGFKETWVSGTSPKEFTNLDPGKYTLKETIAPNGYILSEDTITFTVDKDGNVAKPVVMKNYPEGKTTISKQDATTGKELPGATLELTRPNGKTETWVSTNEPHLIKNLQPGKYTLKETIAPNGYILSQEKVTFNVNKEGKVDKKVVMKNYPEGKVSISKVDATTGKELPGATLELTGPNGFKETWVSTSEPHLIENLKPGKYTLTETIAPKGYKLSTETVEFTVDKDGKVESQVVMKNYPLGSVSISKQDVTTKEELYGAHLEVYKEDGTLVESWISGKEPHTIEGLDAGKYYLKETIAPDGYILSEETVEFEVDENGNVADVVVMFNERIPDVPVPITSSFKNIATSIIGIITMVLGAIIIKLNYKKNEEK